MAMTVQDVNGAYSIFGLSSDTKPTSKKVANGTIFIEMDTMKCFFWDAENEKWIPVK